MKYSSFANYYFKAKDGLEVKSGREMKRVLGLFQLTAFGVSAIIGGGIFVVTGLQAKTNAGPAVMLSYLISGAIATLTALCYAEFASEVVITGGAFAYAIMLYGKFFGWIVGANVMLEYLLAGSTVAKGFASYFTTLIGQKSGSLQFCVHACDDKLSALVIDPIALAAVVILTLVMVFGVKESFWFNVGTVVVSVIAILMCIFLGAPKVNRANFTEPDGFLPFGMYGVIKAASSVFFAYVGFDMIANGAEEAINPNRDIPLATALCLGVCTVMYAAASTVIVGMVKYTKIDSNAPFSVALGQFYPWASYIVSIGACAGTFNSCFADLYAMSRLMVVQARCRVIPAWLAAINPRTESPIIATVITGTIVGLLAFFVPLEVLADLVSMGTLFAFTVVDISVSVRARINPDSPAGTKMRVGAMCFLVVAGSLMIAFAYYYKAHWGIEVAGACVWLVGTLAFYTLPVVFRPKGFAVPFNPILPNLGALASIFLLGSLGPGTWLPWLGAMGAAVVLFLLNGLYQRQTWWLKGGAETEFEEVDAVTAKPPPREGSVFGHSFQVAVPPGGPVAKV